MYDAIIVGARCAGAPVAALLANAGHRVLLVDRATFPSDMPMSTHLIWPAGVVRLQRWGVLDRVRESCPPISDYDFDLGPFTLSGPPVSMEGIGDAYSPRREGHREERWLRGSTPNFFRRPFGPGWALVGDAGYTKDPCTAAGITDAYRDAETVAGAIDDGLSGRRPMEEALAYYELRRNQVAKPFYDFICEVATFAPPGPEALALYSALHGNPAETARFFGLFAQTVSPAEFFAPESIEQILNGPGPSIGAYRTGRSNT